MKCHWCGSTNFMRTREGCYGSIMHFICKECHHEWDAVEACDSDMCELCPEHIFVICNNGKPKKCLREEIEKEDLIDEVTDCVEGRR